MKHGNGRAHYSWKHASYSTFLVLYKFFGRYLNVHNFTSVSVLFHNYVQQAQSFK